LIASRLPLAQLMVDMMVPGGEGWGSIIGFRLYHIFSILGLFSIKSFAFIV
jgi:hypothetical protein